jgi:hypothetical protein
MVMLPKPLVLDAPQLWIVRGAVDAPADPKGREELAGVRIKNHQLPVAGGREQRVMAGVER